MLSFLPSSFYRSDSSTCAPSHKPVTSIPLASNRSVLSPLAHVVKTSTSTLNSTYLTLLDGLTDDERLAATKKAERHQILILRLKNATTLVEWKAAAKELDIFEGNDVWKLDNTSGDFDIDLITVRIKDLDDARINRDIPRMLHLIRTSLSRDLGGMTNTSLYQHSHIGTKELIERYIESATSTICLLVELSKLPLPEHLSSKHLLDAVLLARQAFGRSALLLSGGATFGMYHIGVLKALFEAQLLPRIISGASAGSIVASVLCTRTDEEIPPMLKRFPYGDLAVFEPADGGETVLERVGRFLTQGNWIDIAHLVRVMRELLGDMTFQEAYNRTRRILNICVSSASIYELPTLLNYVTAPNVLIWSAVAASCSVPVVFSAGHLLVKNPITGEQSRWNAAQQGWIDGSVDGDLPMVRLAEMFNVNHFIVSQVNPHVVPFLSESFPSASSSPSAPISAHSLCGISVEGTPSWKARLISLAKSEALHRLHILTDLPLPGPLRNLTSKARSILNQKYSGDITILPQLAYADFPNLLRNPTPEFMLEACRRGERATWPLVGRIRVAVSVELTLDRAVGGLREGVVFGQETGAAGVHASHIDISSRQARKRTVSGGQLRGKLHGHGKERARPGMRTSQSYTMPSLRVVTGLMRGRGVGEYGAPRSMEEWVKGWHHGPDVEMEVNQANSSDEVEMEDVEQGQSPEQDTELDLGIESHSEDSVEDQEDEGVVAE
jgi:TAG lipase/steryl ester hydrolase/phospholipase A2/LPA acyltransferase